MQHYANKNKSVRYWTIVITTIAAMSWFVINAIVPNLSPVFSTALWMIMAASFGFSEGSQYMFEQTRKEKIND